MAVIVKSREMKNARISFVSLVDKASNKKQFIMTKSEDGESTFQTFGKIIKSDAEAHYVTGVVYAPLEEDTDGDFMTEEEITKAAHWFMKNGIGVDLQHNFEPLESAIVVESYVTKSDTEINGESIKQGTWLMTVEITDDEIFSAIEKGEITGFSMGGVVNYVDDVEIPSEPTQKSKKGILKQLAEMFGFDVIEKGKVRENYITRITSENFWQAFYALQDALFSWDWHTDTCVSETNLEVIQEALTDFNEIVTELLTGAVPVTKSVNEIMKAGKVISTKNKETLRSIYDNLGDFLSNFEEEGEVTKSEIEQIVADVVTKAMQLKEPGATLAKQSKEKITPEIIEKMVTDVMAKAMQPKEESLTMEQIKDVIEKSVAKAVEPVLKATGVPSNLDGLGQVEKSEDHYLKGIL